MQLKRSARIALAKAPGNKLRVTLRVKLDAGATSAKKLNLKG